MQAQRSLGLRTALVAGGLNGLLAVGLGALAAHGLRENASAEALGWLETGARYGLAHGLALLALAALSARGGKPSRWLTLAIAAFAPGTLLFSGTLYVMALLDWRGPAPLVPLGGVLMVLGWAFVLLYGLTARRGGQTD